MWDMALTRAGVPRGLLGSREEGATAARRRRRAPAALRLRPVGATVQSSGGAAGSPELASAAPDHQQGGSREPPSPASPGASPAAAALEYRLATNEDFWAVADVHCAAFYPDPSPFWDPLHRLDRVLSLQVGSQTQAGKFACIIAVGDMRQQSGSGVGASGTEPLPLGPFATALSKLVLQETSQVNRGARHEAWGIWGAVTLDTMLLFIPGKRVVTPNGNTREVKRGHMAYLSNLAVSPAAQRLGIGRELALRAEQLAREWGCRSVALHVDRSNEAALRLYKAEGYREAFQQSEWEALLEGRRTPLVLMLKPLGSGGRRQAAAT